MRVPRQADPTEGGRVHQKRRTRAAIVGAAQDLLARGITPTVPQAAAEAEVSRTTAYRYFPTQDSLLVEVAMGASVEDVEELVARPVDPAGAKQRVLEVLDLFGRLIDDAEAQYRTALRLYLDEWLQQVGRGDEPPVLREGRRRRWFEQSLAPLRDTVGDETWERVVLGLCFLTGAEGLVVRHDVCRIDDETGRDVVRWAAQALLDAAFPEDEG